MSNEKKAKRKDIIVVAVILLLVAVLLVIGRRSCTITLTTPEDMEVSYVWCEVYNDGRVAVCTDAGGVSQHEYVVRYKAVGGAGESVVLFACIDTETGDEMCDRVAYKITANGLGFLRAMFHRATLVCQQMHLLLCRSTPKGTTQNFVRQR